jgi:hypothetical protein
MSREQSWDVNICDNIRSVTSMSGRSGRSTGSGFSCKDAE